jgi:hypothetical protein
MKKLILAFAIAGLAVACKNTDNTSVSDPATANAPATACSTKADSGCCASKDAASCADAAATCDKAATECDGSEAKVCPVSGEKVEN